MRIFWDNVTKFPRFFLSVLAGFFLTIFYPIFMLFKKPVNKFMFITITCIIIVMLLRILNKMLDIS